MIICGLPFVYLWQSLWCALTDRPVCRCLELLPLQTQISKRACLLLCFGEQAALSLSSIRMSSVVVRFFIALYRRHESHSRSLMFVCLNVWSVGCFGFLFDGGGFFCWWRRCSSSCSQLVVFSRGCNNIHRNVVLVFCCLSGVTFFIRCSDIFLVGSGGRVCFLFVCWA